MAAADWLASEKVPSLSSMDILQSLQEGFSWLSEDSARPNCAPNASRPLEKCRCNQRKSLDHHPPDPGSSSAQDTAF